MTTEAGKVRRYEVGPNGLRMHCEGSVVAYTDYEASERDKNAAFREADTLRRDLEVANAAAHLYRVGAEQRIAELEQQLKALDDKTWATPHFENVLDQLNDAINGSGKAQQDRIADLEAQVEALSKDAGRYRWLREECRKYSGGLTIAKATRWDLVAWGGDDPDKAIDAAIAAEGEKNAKPK